jgi:hypothetical protein
MENPTEYENDKRLREVAAILAAGILRLRSGAVLSANPEKHSGAKNSQIPV